jgi:uncharacterized UPF0160 family protein
LEQPAPALKDLSLRHTSPPERHILNFYNPLSFPEADNERRHERHSLALAVSVRELRSVAVRATTKNVSLGGCCLIGSDLSERAEIWITFPSQAPMRARVVWIKGNEVGCEFYVAFRRAELWRLLSKPRPVE